jgi:hypothetical protein
MGVDFQQDLPHLPNPDPLAFPFHGMTGPAGDYAKLYSEYLESPPQFICRSFLTCLGSLTADWLTAASELISTQALYTYSWPIRR